MQNERILCDAILCDVCITGNYALNCLDWRIVSTLSDWKNNG